MGEIIRYAIERKTASAYLAAQGRPGPGILLLHSWWGLNNCFRELADQLAAEGYTVLAPDLYNGEVAATIEQAKLLRGAKTPIPRATMVAEAARYLQTVADPGRQIGVIGFSLGASFALALAEGRPDNISAVVTFYGARTGDYSGSHASFMGHFAESDPYVNDVGLKNMRDALKRAHRPFEAYTYPGTTHWFFENDRPEYNPGAAEIAWERTLTFLRAMLFAP